MIQRPGQSLHALRVDQTERWLQPDDAAISRRNTDRTAGIRAEGRETEAGTDRCRRSATRSARGSLGIAGIVGLAEIRMHRAIGVFQQIGLAKNDRARFLLEPP